MNLDWEHSEYIYLLLGIPLLFGIFLGYSLWRKRSLKKLGNPQQLQYLMPDTSHKQWIHMGLYLIAILCCILAIVSPRYPETVTAPDVPVADVVFMVDISTSMLASDMAPSRLEKVKQVLSQSIANLDKSRVGVVLYAAQAYPFLPFTEDMNVAVSFIPAIQPSLISQQGTQLTKAMEMAGYYFSDTARNNQVIFLFSDGENHDSEFLKSVEKQAARGIVIHTIGVGTETGSQITVSDAHGKSSVKKDAAGLPVLTRMVPNNLRQIAEAGKGQFYSISSTQETMQFIQQQIEAARLSIGKPPQITGYTYLFQWLAGISLVCIFLDMILGVFYKYRIPSPFSSYK
ncbi:VWA domain-containing protein [Cytophagaceae bacterium DM2B3-1]|uniref:VWA domain-containing protein n=1 Tax=Xanthocytophaga flava TaxID=3048013 RepID=A0ABT7CEU0_9BACT|nr:VWA domain-containing protein [Xanthocytophaga flavus]MDJ1492228.1 VWA domain-containing protein [Xanthocytophaga flavus]